MKRIFALLLFAGASFAQSDAPPQPKHDLAAERQQALDFLQRAQPLNALPMVEDLVAANPDDAAVQGWLAYCLFAKSRHGATSQETPALLKRSREAALRARQLGSTWPLLNELLAVLDTPAAAKPEYSTNPEVNARIKAGEDAFARGDNEGALAAYAAALKLDSKLYVAALFAGDVCFRTKDTACAANWFGRAVTIDPARETAYRYWGDALMAAGRMTEARDKFIEAVIAEPTQKPWAGLANWAKRNNCQLAVPKIDLALIKNYPKADSHHSLADALAALNSALAGSPDPQLANVISLKKDGLLEAWILLNGGSDPAVAREYAGYRDAHHSELRAYFDKYIIHPAPPQ